MINILVIDNSSHITGAFKAIVNLTSGIEGCNFIFITPSNSNKKKLESLGFQAHQVSFIEIQKNWRTILYIPYLIFNFFLLRKYVKKHDIDIIHVNDMYNMTGVLLKIFSSIKLIYHIRLLRNSYVHSLYTFWSLIIKLFADQVIYVSEAVSKDFGHTIKGILLYDTIDFKEENIDTIEKRSKGFRFIYPSNYISGKGHLDALFAFDRIRKHHDNIHLTFIGGTLGRKANQDFMNMLIREVERKEANDQITVKGFSVDVINEMYNHDVVLMFSESESFSLVCLEGALVKRPVIATDCGGPAEIIVNDKTGKLVEIGNINAMCNAMEFLIKNKKTGEQMGKEAYDFCTKKFSKEESKKSILEIYRNLN